MRQPGIEPGPLPWKGRILTIRPLTHRNYVFWKPTSRSATWIIPEGKMRVSQFRCIICSLGTILAIGLFVNIRFSAQCLTYVYSLSYILESQTKQVERVIFPVL